MRECSQITLIIIGNKMSKNRMSVRALKDFEKHLKDDILVEESLVVKKVDLWETYVEKEEKEYNKDCDEITRGVDLDTYYEENSIPLSELIPFGMTIKEYFGKEQRLLRGENISYVKFD